MAETTLWVAQLVYVTRDYLRQRDTLNLHIDALGQLLDGDSTARWLVREPLCVLLVHALPILVSLNGCDSDQASSAGEPDEGKWASETYGKVGHVRQEHIDLDNLLNRRASLLQHGLQVADA
jgi:hypothetical protein